MSETQKIISAYVRQLRPDLLGNQMPLETMPLHDLIDSISMLDLLCFLEEQFTIILYDDEIAREQFETITAISLFIEKKRERHAGVKETSPRELNSLRE